MLFFTKSLTIMSLSVGSLLVCCALFVASVQGAITGRIVGGDNAEDAQFPYQVSVRKFGSHSCGGSILSEKFILTAARCAVDVNFMPQPASVFSIRAGSTDQFNNGVVVGVKAITIHENYDKDTLNNIAVVELLEPLTFSETIQPIELETENIPAGSDVVVSGWGYESPNTFKSPAKLNYNTLTVMSPMQCYIAIGVTSEDILCLGHSKYNGICTGDSGGPATYNGKLVGVAGFVAGFCGTTSPDGFVKVSYHAEWIKSIIS